MPSILKNPITAILLIAVFFIGLLFLSDHASDSHIFGLKERILLPQKMNANRVLHTCVHDKVMKGAKIETPESKLSEEELRNLADAPVGPIRIVFDTSLLSSSDPKILTIKNELLPVAQNFLSRRIQVKQRQNLLSIPKYINDCIRQPISPQHKEPKGIVGDLLIYVTTGYESGSALAWAGSCLLDPDFNRPYVGRINFNLAKFTGEDSFESQVDTTIHELTHVLGFSDGWFKYFRLNGQPYTNPITTVANRRSGRKTLLTTPNVLKYAREYFRCPDLEGVELEDQGGSGSAGSHWERTTLFNEMMTASSIEDASYSEFTLAFLQDTGFYHSVDRKLAEPFYFLKGSGCALAREACQSGVQNDWFCPVQGEKKKCTREGWAKGYCDNQGFSDQCNFIMGFSNGDCRNSKNSSPNDEAFGETYSSQSKCAVSSIMQKGYVPIGAGSHCYKFRCNGSSELIFSIGKGATAFDLVCRRSGEIVKPPAKADFQGELTCPDPTLYCSTFYPSCPDNCGGRGYCVNGACECRPGTRGPTCSL